MKIAVASTDGISISQHFGRSAAWLVFDVEEGRVTGPEIRSNQHTNHAAGGCSHEDGEHHDHEHGEQHGQHSHAGLIDALHDCEAILCGGMGWRAAEDLKRNGIQPFIVDPRTTPQDAVQSFLTGQLSTVEQGFCRGRH